MIPKFEIVDEHTILDRLGKGYEIVHTFQSVWTGTRNVNGSMMNNSFHINDLPVKEISTKFIVKRSAQAEVLFGEKNENKPANT